MRSFIDIEKILGTNKAEMWETGPVMMVNPQDDGVYELLKQNSDNFYVYRKEELPDFYFYSDHRDSTNIIRNINSYIRKIAIKLDLKLTFGTDYHGPNHSHNVLDFSEQFDENFTEFQGFPNYS